MPKNKIQDLRNMLFETMERLLDDDDEKMDLQRAETVAKVAQTVINTAKVEVDFLRISGSGGSEFLQGDIQLPSPQQVRSQLKPVNAGSDSNINECLNCTLPECNESSPDCLIQIQKRAA